MTHRYISTSDFRAPFDSPNLSLSGALGDDEPWPTESRWPTRRTYQDVSDFRAPGDRGEWHRFPPLLGLGALGAAAPHSMSHSDQRAPVVAATDLPDAFQRYATSGETMPAWKRDLGAALNQVPRWAWGIIGAVGLYGAYKSYKDWKKDRRGGTSGG